MSNHDCKTNEVAHARGILLEHLKTVKLALIHHLEAGDRNHEAGLQLHRNVADLQRAVDVLGYGGTITPSDRG